MSAHLPYDSYKHAARTLGISDSLKAACSDAISKLQDKTNPYDGAKIDRDFATMVVMSAWQDVELEIIDPVVVKLKNRPGGECHAEKMEWLKEFAERKEKLEQEQRSPSSRNR